MGRKLTYTDEAAERIVSGLRKGIPLTVICDTDPTLPCDDTVRAWGERDADFSRAIARARRTGADVIAHRARMTLRGKTAEEGGDSTGDVQRDKAIADYDLKLLAKWDPRYAEMQKHEITGADGAPVATSLTVSFVKA